MTNVPPPLQTARPRLAARRCERHQEREAAGRCTTCHGFFCRECIGEHEGVFVCSRCLEKKATAAPEKRLRRWKEPLLVGAGLLVGWIFFHHTGKLLLALPREWHDGTIWNR